MIIQGDCLNEINKLQSNSIDSIVTDPPYGLKFMGKKWDYDVPSREVWAECLRVLKPGGHVLSFCGTRTYHRMVVRIEDAGFEIRDQIQWIYGSGFPKSHNIKEGEFKGWGTALKPANEPICLARKPLEGTVAQNVQKWGTGAINVDASRIATEDKIASTTNQNIRGHMIGSGNNERDRDTTYNQNPQGRWPANVIFDEEAAAILDEHSGQFAGQVGMKKTAGVVTHQPGKSVPGQAFKLGKKYFGGASRFFYVAKASKRERNTGLEGMPEKSTGQRIKAQSAGRTDAGKQESSFPQANHHPTVKPIKLMEYLIKLITPPCGTVLDPFMGSGSTGVAAKALGFEFIGIEREAEYVEIANKRIKSNNIQQSLLIEP